MGIGQDVFLLYIGVKQTEQAHNQSKSGTRSAKTGVSGYTRLKVWSMLTEPHEGHFSSLP